MFERGIERPRSRRVTAIEGVLDRKPTNVGRWQVVSKPYLLSIGVRPVRGPVAERAFEQPPQLNE